MSLFTQEYRFEFEGSKLRIDNPYDRVFQVKPEGRKKFQFPKWFKKSGSRYITCSAIKFDHQDGDDRYLVWPYSSDASVSGYWDGAKLTLIRMKHIESLALFCGDRITVLRTWTPRRHVLDKPVERIFNLTCDNTYECLLIYQLPELEKDPGVRPELPCVFGEPTAIEELISLS